VIGNEEMISYRSVASANKDLVAWLAVLPDDIDIVAGIPRSGLLIANLLSLHMNIPLTDVDGLIVGRVIETGSRYRGDAERLLSSPRKVLVVDDSLTTGSQMQLARKRIEHARLIHQVQYCAVFVEPGSEHMVDHFCEALPSPRVFEWNIVHTPLAKDFCFDIDGVLCRDPTSEENDDGPRYEQFIKSVEPMLVPSHEVGWLVTCRLEKYRRMTEAWLAKHRVNYRELIMMDYPTKEARMAAGAYAPFKADVYQRTNAKLFIESSPRLADQIAELSGQPVFCSATREMVYPGSVSSHYHRGRRLARLLRQNPKQALTRLMHYGRKCLGKTTRGTS
jgi:orotate phosphoribosyltransferase